MKTPDRYTKFRKKVPKKAGTYTYTMSMWEPPRALPLPGIITEWLLQYNNASSCEHLMHKIVHTALNQAPSQRVGLRMVQCNPMIHLPNGPLLATNGVFARGHNGFILPIGHYLEFKLGYLKN